MKILIWLWKQLGSNFVVTSISDYMLGHKPSAWNNFDLTWPDSFCAHCPPEHGMIFFCFCPSIHPSFRLSIYSSSCPSVGTSICLLSIQDDSTHWRTWKINEKKEKFPLNNFRGQNLGRSLRQASSSQRPRTWSQSGIRSQNLGLEGLIPQTSSQNLGFPARFWPFCLDLAIFLGFRPYCLDLGY